MVKRMTVTDNSGQLKGVHDDPDKIDYYQVKWSRLRQNRKILNKEGNLLHQREQDVDDSEEEEKEKTCSNFSKQ